MIVKDDVDSVLDKMILSASGWRGVFTVCGDEESDNSQISEAFRIICGAAAFVFADYIRLIDNKSCSHCKPLILLGTDTRPTGKAIVDTMIPVLLSAGCDVCYAGVTAAPEIMAWARSMGQSMYTFMNVYKEVSKSCGFIYISASHNPIGHNGLKFGVTDGGVLAAGEANKLIAGFRGFFEKDNCIEKIESLINNADPGQVAEVYANTAAAKLKAYKAYYDFCKDVVFSNNTQPSIFTAMKDGLEKKPLGIVCDFNGSARTVSIDRNFFSDIGFKFKCINDKPGQIAHRIVPEGESLEPCRILLEEARKDTSFVMGYVPDCDGDRGNLVIWDETINRARSLEAQEVFALAVVAELSHLVWTGNFDPGAANNKSCKCAVAINDPTSMRVDRIAEAFGVSVFRAEVGEANVVSLARKLREEEYIVRILGEGSAGGNITHPSAVRDPINTVLAIAKMLSVRSSAGTPGLFEIWCKCSGQTEKYRDDFTLADIIASLPVFATTEAYNEDAVMRIKTNDHAVLKDRYQEVFLREWEKRKEQFKVRYGFNSWDAIAYNGMTERRGLKRFGEAEKGGLKVLFFDDNGSEIAYIWMRGSATEPVFRIMADVSLTVCKDYDLERDLLSWQRQMIMEADSECFSKLG